MKKFMTLALVMVFAMGISVSSAIGAGPYLKWDVGQDGSFDTVANLKPGHSLVVDLWVTDIGASNVTYFSIGNVSQTIPGLNYQDGNTTIFEWDGSTKPGVTVDAWWNFNPATDIATEGLIGAWGGRLTSDNATRRLITIEFKCVNAGTDTFDFTEAGEEFHIGNYLSANATKYALTVICKEENEAPECEDQYLTTFKDIPIDIILVATDDPGDNITYSISSLPANGSLSDNDTLDSDNVTYTPDSGWSGGDSFTFQAKDDGNLTCEGTVSITVFSTEAVQMVMPRLWPCTPPYHWWFENPDGDSMPTMTATPNEEVCFYVNYDAFDGMGSRETELSGIGFWVNYDPYFFIDPVVDKDIKHIFPKGYVNVLNSPEIVDADGGRKKFLMAWADPSSPPAWPNEPLPLEIFKVCFVVQDNSLLCGSSTEIMFTDPHTVIGYEFYSESMEVKIVSFNIDIDADNMIKPLTDGLLITRYLFGFKGNNLISGAVNELGGSRTGASEIADWIERGRVEPSAVDNSYTHLDIDANREVTALTDGIMILRQLFGYTGANLTAGAIGPNATRYNSSSIKTYIDSLKP